jgi:hypothetical protein
MINDIRNLQFATILTEMANHELSDKMKEELEIIKLTIMTIGRENTVREGDNSDNFTNEMGALSLLMMAAHWMVETDLLAIEGGE